MTPTELPFDDPAKLAADVAALGRPLLIGLDVDGVLAPIVGHAGDAELLPGTLDLVAGLSVRTPVGIVSGRSITDLARFGFPEALMVSGSHGSERRGRVLAELSPQESSRLERLRHLAERAATDAGRGAWVETKPTGVVLHVREADPSRSIAAVHDLARTAVRVTGADVKRGRSVIELAARRASKATAIAEMVSEVGALAIVFIGDDLTDEDVFAVLGPGDIGIQVGLGPTGATRRLRNPAAVHHLLRSLTALLAAG